MSEDKSKSNEDAQSENNIEPKVEKSPKEIKVKNTLSWFVSQMYQVLTAERNLIKPEWDGIEIDRFIDKLNYNAHTIIVPIASPRITKSGASKDADEDGLDIDIDASIKQCVDVADYAMIVADKLRIMREDARKAK